MVRKISGKGCQAPLKHLNSNHTLITDVKDISNTLGTTFAHNSSTNHYTPEFQQYKAIQEKIPINFKSRNTEPYNCLFTMRELTDALKSAHDSSPGPDNVHYQFLKHLPDTSRKLVLNIINHIWTNDAFPQSWHQATVIAIPKPDKDHTDPNSYRPIALTSCVCKTMERMVNNRLVYYLEANGLISNIQSGFRKRRSTTDQLVRLETWIREGLVNKEHEVAVFFTSKKPMIRRGSMVYYQTFSRRV